MTQEIGADRAQNVGDAHERTGQNPGGEMIMDLINNHNGRVLGEALPDATPREIAREAADKGYLQPAPIAPDWNRKK